MRCDAATRPASTRAICARPWRPPRAFRMSARPPRAWPRQASRQPLAKPGSAGSNVATRSPSVVRDLEELRSDARYSRERVALYRARSYGPRPTSPARLRELERVAEAAEARLEHAEGQDEVG